MKNKFSNYFLRPLISTDALVLHAFIIENQERLKRYFPVTLSSNSTLEKTKEYISAKSEEIVEKVNFTFAIKENISHQIAGLIILKKIDWVKKQGEYAYCIGSQYEGKGITSFAVKEMTKFAFAELGLQTLQIIAHKSNLGSVKVALNNGFTWQRTLKNEFTPKDELPLDMELYELYNEK